MRDVDTMADFYEKVREYIMEKDEEMTSDSLMKGLLKDKVLIVENVPVIPVVLFNMEFNKELEKKKRDGQYFYTRR